MSRWVVVLLLGAALAGCATRREVLELAERTGANVSLVRTQLGDFAQDSRRRAEARAATIAHLDGKVSEALNRLTARRRALDVAGESDKLALYDMIREDAIKLEEAQAAIVTAELERRQAILADEAKFEPPAEQLKAVASGLAELGKEEDFLARLRFLAGFVKEVKKDIDDAEKTKKDKDAAAKADLERKKVGTTDPEKID